MQLLEQGFHGVHPPYCGAGAAEGPAVEDFVLATAFCTICMRVYSKLHIEQIHSFLSCRSTARLTHIQPKAKPYIRSQQ